MAKVTIIMEDDAVNPADQNEVRMARMEVQILLTEDEKDLPPSIAVLAGHYFRTCWMEKGIPLLEVQERVNAEIAAEQATANVRADAPTDAAVPT